MKKQWLCYVIVGMLVIFSSCKKKDFWKKECGVKDIGICNGDQTKQYNNTDYIEYIVKPIVVSPDCNCIVQGFLKYVKNNKTVALIDYGNGECDEWAVKINCVDGDCEHKMATKCKFEIDCNVEDDGEDGAEKSSIDKLYGYMGIGCPSF